MDCLDAGHGGSRLLQNVYNNLLTHTMSHTISLDPSSTPV